MVTVGSHGPDGFERFALGSVAEKIARNVTSPVLIMGPHSHSEGELFKSILFATNLSSTGSRPAQYAFSFAERFRSRLSVLHVMEERTANRSPIQSESQGSLLQAMQPLLAKYVDPSLHPEFRVEYGTPSECIVRTARSVGANLVVLGGRRQPAFADHLPWLTLSKVIREAGCGVLVVHNRPV